MRKRALQLVAAACACAALVLPASAAAADSQPRVVGGSQVSGASYPWQAAVMFSSARFSGNDYQRQFCGGVLVAPQIVLTAAHCLYDSDPDGNVDLLGNCTVPGDPN